MGCHTWFSRPITEEEFELMKQYAQLKFIIWLAIQKKI